MIDVLFLFQAAFSGMNFEGLNISCLCAHEKICYFCATSDLNQKTSAFYKCVGESVEKVARSKAFATSIARSKKNFVVGTDEGKIILYDFDFNELSATRIHGCSKITSIVVVDTNVCYFTDFSKRVYKFDLSDLSCMSLLEKSANSLKYNHIDSRLYLIDSMSIVCLNARGMQEIYHFRTKERIHDAFCNDRNSEILVTRFCHRDEKTRLAEPGINPVILGIEGSGKINCQYIVDIPGEIFSLDINARTCVSVVSIENNVFNFGFFNLKDKVFVSRGIKRENVNLVMKSSGFFDLFPIIHGGECVWLTSEHCLFAINFSKRILSVLD